MKQRILTAAILLAIGFPLLFWGGMPFYLVVIILANIGFIELMQMAHIRLKSPETVLGVIATTALAVPNHYYDYWRILLSPLLILCICCFAMLVIMVFSKNAFSFENVGRVCLGALYVGLGAHYIIQTRILGFWASVFIFSIAWVSDSGAYFVGRSFGKRKLAPDISPNKTVEGSLGGVLLVALYATIVYFIAPPFEISYLLTVIIAILVAVSGQMGDLVESAIKRFYNVKDSGNLIPGHGGVLDRFDSTLFGVVAFYIMYILFVR